MVAMAIAGTAILLPTAVCVEIRTGRTSIRTARWRTATRIVASSTVAAELTIRAVRRRASGNLHRTSRNHTCARRRMRLADDPGRHRVTPLTGGARPLRSDRMCGTTQRTVHKTGDHSTTDRGTTT